MADLGHLNTGYPLRDALAARDSEEQFVVVAAVQGGLKVNFAARFSDVGEGYGVRANFSAHTAFFADVAEVGGEAVAEVDHGGSQVLLEQELTDGDSGLGVKVLGELGGAKFTFGEEQAQSGGGAAEFASHINAVAGFRTRAPDGFARWGGADDYDIGQNSGGRLGNVAAGEGDLKCIGQPEQAGEKAVDPVLRQISRQGQRQKGSDGPASHGSNVAEPAGKAAMADHLGSVPVAAKVDAFKAEIGGHEGLVSGGDSQYSAVVTNTDANRGPAAFRPGTDALDNRLFWERQANSIYKRAALRELTRPGNQSQ